MMKPLEVMVSRGGVIGVQRRVKIVNAAVFFRKAAIPIETQSRRQTQVGAELELVLHVRARLPGAVVAVGIALQELGGGEIVVGSHQALNKLRKIGRSDDALIGSSVARVELGEGIATAERDRCAAPDSKWHSPMA